jgi:transposase-like protein
LVIKGILECAIVRTSLPEANGIESFWGYAKIRLVKFKGMNKDMFKYHLKECEFRFNNRKQNLCKFFLENFRKEPLN